MRGEILLAGIVWSVAVSSSLDASAIVIRHDRDDADYITLGAGYPAATSILPDGSGTLIAPRYVLTAAHVAEGVARRSPRVEIAGREHEVDRIFTHPDWQQRGPNDVGLLRLREPVTDVEPARLYRNRDETGRDVVFVGRGDHGTGETGPTSMDRQVRGATNRIDDADEAWVYFTFDEPGEATDLEGVSGPGDSGGPAFTEVGGDTFVLGVSSHSFNGKPGRYGVREAYARVSSYVDWIEGIVSGTSNETGFAPGEPSISDSHARQVVRPRSSRIDLSEVDGATTIEAYLVAYNSGDARRMSEFLDASATERYRSWRSMEEHLAFYDRLRNALGSLELTDVVEASVDRVVIRVAGSAGPDAEIHFGLDGDARVDDLMVGIIKIDRD